DQHRAGPALPAIAAGLGAGEGRAFAQVVEQQSIVRDGIHARTAVERQLEDARLCRRFSGHVGGHGMSFPLPAIIARTLLPRTLLPRTLYPGSLPRTLYPGSLARTRLPRAPPATADGGRPQRPATIGQNGLGYQSIFLSPLWLERLRPWAQIDL